MSPQYQFIERWSPVNHGMFKGGFVIVLRKFPKEVSEVLESCGMRLETLKEGHSPECNFGGEIFRWPSENIFEQDICGKNFNVL